MCPMYVPDARGVQKSVFDCPEPGVQMVVSHHGGDQTLIFHKYLATELVT